MEQERRPPTTTPAGAQRAVGQRIRQRRQALGWSQQMLASRAQVHRTYVTSVESGARNLSLLNMLRLAYELDMDPGDLVEGIHLPCSVVRGQAQIVLDDTDEHRVTAAAAAAASAGRTVALADRYELRMQTSAAF